MRKPLLALGVPRVQYEGCCTQELHQGCTWNPSIMFSSAALSPLRIQDLAPYLQLMYRLQQLWSSTITLFKSQQVNKKRRGMKPPAKHAARGGSPLHLTVKALFFIKAQQVQRWDRNDIMRNFWYDPTKSLLPLLTPPPSPVFPLWRTSCGERRGSLRVDLNYMHYQT